MGPAAIVSPTAVRKWKREFGRHPVGAGPYRFVEWIPGDRITLERNPDYWDERAHTRYLVLIAMPDSRQRLQALESGAADVIQQLAPDDLPLVRLNPDLGLAMAPATLVVVPGDEHASAGRSTTCASGARSRTRSTGTRW